jgi:hypothetical protein
MLHQLTLSMQALGGSSANLWCLLDSRPGHNVLKIHFNIISPYWHPHHHWSLCPMNRWVTSSSLSHCIPGEHPWREPHWRARLLPVRCYDPLWKYKQKFWCLKFRIVWEVVMVYFKVVFKDLCGGTMNIRGLDCVRRSQSILYCNFAKRNVFWHKNEGVPTWCHLPADTSRAAQSRPGQTVPASCKQDSVHFNYHITNLIFGLIINYYIIIFHLIKFIKLLFTFIYSKSLKFCELW